MTKIRIPKRFFDDHEERELPTPRHGIWRNGYVIDTADKNFAELVNDATHYATDGCDCEPGLKRAAKALLKTINKEVGFLHAVGIPATMRCPVCNITVLTSSDNKTGHCTQHKP